MIGWLALLVSSFSEAGNTREWLKSTTAIEYAAMEQATISPRWLPGGDAFWYRHDLAHGGFEFVFVDIVAKTRQKAFDHQTAAQQLQQLTKQTTDAESLPFRWIDPAPDASHVRFRAHGKAWTFASDGTLEEWDGPLSNEMPKLLGRETASPFSDAKVDITFVNHATRQLTLEWIDFEGNAVFYGTVDV